MKYAATFSFVLIAAACPGPAQDIDSVDGLGGGELTSGLTAPSITVESLTSATSSLGDASAKSVSVDDGVTATSVTTENLVVTGPVEVLDVTTLDAGAMSAETAEIGAVTADSYAQPDPSPDFAPRALAGVPVGVTTFSVVGNALCTNAFPTTAANPRGAHVCTRDEVLRNQFVLEADVDTYRNAAFAGFSAELVGFVDNDLAQPIRATDCANWLGAGSAQGYTPARHTIEFDSLNRLIPGFSTDCSNTAKIACCQ